VFSREWVEPLAQVLAKLGSRHVLVVHSEDGLDEISLGAPTHVAELRDGQVTTYSVTPEEFGFHRAPVDTLKVDSVEHSALVLRSVLDNEPGPARDVVALNAGAAIYAADLAASLTEGVAMAKAAIERGAARTKLDELIRLTNSF
jgi:anthranilate phosphoribosyltransferase